MAAGKRRHVRISSAGVGYAPFLYPAVWLADHLGKLGDKPLAWIDHHHTAKGFRDGFLMLAEGESDLCMANTRGICSMFMRGNGLFQRPYPNLRALLTLPHYDWSTFAVASSLGIRSFAELKEKKPALKIVTGYLDGDNVVGYLALDILRRHGISREDIESWGGEFVSVGIFNSCAEVESGRANAICEEGAYAEHFRKLFRNRPMTCLSMEPRVVRELEEEYGWGSLTIPANFYHGQTEPFVAPDYSSWIVCAREDFDDDLAYAIARFAVEHGQELSAPHLHGATYMPWPFPLPPVLPNETANTTPVPLHAGSARLYEERGLLGSKATYVPW